MSVSTLELFPVWDGQPTQQSLDVAVEFACEAESLGYRRIWIGEHHNSPGLAAAATPLLVQVLANATTRIRIGSGGMLLPNHSPLVIAEQFATLEMLHQDRIDLGVGQASGADRNAAALLDRGRRGNDLEILLALLFSPTDLSVVATPAHEHRPPVYLLGASVDSAVQAARLGLPYAYAHHINPAATVDALRTYRTEFRPGPLGATPWAMLAAFVLLAGTDDDATRAVEPYLSAKALIRRGVRLDALPLSPATVSSEEADAIRLWASHQFVGSAEAAGRRLALLRAASGADELLALTLTPDLDARRTSPSETSTQTSHHPQRSS